MSAKKTFNILIIFMIFIMATVPSSEAWSWKTHSEIADFVYQGLPPEVQKNLNLEIMKNASNDPDEVFKDFTTHSYPKSYQKAKTWLDKGKIAYDRGDYKEASYDYGVASHYISDTFSAPHCVSKEDSADHSKYEDQAKDLKPAATNVSGDLESLLRNGYTQGGTSWNDWLETKS
ncbi:MAG: zinc dependent phospholipase C family protein, partial [Methanobacterium sp.]|nr:zinc dependent phospholipase C family protein [Methanobacterium sp.]